MKNINFFMLCVSFVVFGLSQGCDDGACEEDSECFADEVCTEGECVVNNPNNTSTNNTSTNNTSTNNTSTNNTSTNNASTNNTSTNNTSTNNTSTNNTSTNNTSTNNTSNNVQPGVCEADPFEMCADPLEAEGSNNTWADADRLGSSAGCVTSRDVIVERTQMAEGIICPREPGDWFGQTIVPCDTVTLTVEVRVTPTPACEADEWNLAINRGGARIGCEDARLTCLQEGATKIVRWTVPPSNSVESWYFGVENTTPVSKFDYTASMTIR